MTPIKHKLENTNFLHFNWNFLNSLTFECYKRYIGSFDYFACNNFSIPISPKTGKIELWITVANPAYKYFKETRNSVLIIN